jgi:uncharacterized cupin superfamily protein
LSLQKTGIRSTTARPYPWNNRGVVPEAPLERSDGGLAPAGEGWFVVNAREARWSINDDFGAFTVFENRDAAEFPQLGINIGVLGPGQPACMYHREDEQEDFLVLSGEALLLIEGEERPLKAWDFVHCPPGTDHVIVGAGDGPCTVLAVGARSGGGIVFPVSKLAQKYGASVQEETKERRVANANAAKSTRVPYRDGWLPS